MHTLVVVIVLVVLVPLMWVFSPQGYVGRRMNRRINGWARQLEEQGRGNFMTKPLWGDRERWRRGAPAKESTPDDRD